MPMFPEFQYFFTIEVLKISLFMIAIVPFFMGFGMIGFPLLYRNYCKDFEYRNVFMTS